jgi:hypothetical protein
MATLNEQRPLHRDGEAEQEIDSQLHGECTDNGTPGTFDTFSIQLSNGYSAGGTLTSGDIEIR